MNEQMQMYRYEFILCHSSRTYQHFLCKYWAPPILNRCSFCCATDVTAACLLDKWQRGVFLLFCSYCPFDFPLPLIQLASLGPSNPNLGRDPVLPARPTVAPVHEEPIFVPARMVSTALTATPLTLSAPVSHPPLCAQIKNKILQNFLCWVSFEKSEE